MVGVIATVAAVLVGAASGEAPGTSWNAATNPFRLTFFAGGKPLVAEALRHGSGGRLGYRLANGSVHTLTMLIRAKAISGGTEYSVRTDERGRTAVVVVRRTRTGATVAFSLQPATGVSETFEGFDAALGEHFLGGGERPAALDLRGQAVVLKTSYACANTMPTPFFASSAGYGVALRGDPIAAMAFPGATLADECAGGSEPPCPLAKNVRVVQICAKSAGLSYTVYAGDPSHVVSHYVSDAGRPQLPPVDQFALVKWRDIVQGPQELYTDVSELRSLQIPIGWVLLDNPWETSDCYGSMVWDVDHFPDSAGMIRKLHGSGVKLMLWISPLVRRQWCPKPSQYSASALLGGGNAATLDLTDPTTANAFETSLRSLIAQGIDGFKADRGDELDFEPLVLAGGSGADVQNLYPLLFSKAVAAAIASSGKTGSFPTMFRATAPGSAALVSGFWGGDQQGTFAGLQQAIHDGLSAGLAGYATWGSDTGGYDKTVSGEVLVRWAQFSAICPIFEIGGIGRNATFWTYGPTVVAGVRDAAVLHYELFPYLFALARAAHSTGLPILRPLALRYPSDPAAWTNDLEVLVGDDLLAAPVTGPAAASARAYLPAGTWVDLATGKTSQGGTTLARRVPVSELPLFQRAGSVIPFAARAPSIWPTPWPVDALQVHGRGGWLYAPGKGASSSSTPDFGSFRATMRGRSITILVSHAPAETQIELVGISAPATVRIDGRAAKAARSDAALRALRAGWETTTTPFRGVVVKLAPRAGSARVEIGLG